MSLRFRRWCRRAHKHSVLLVKFTPLQLPIWMLVLSIVIAAVSKSGRLTLWVADQGSGLPCSVSLLSIYWMQS